ncbi:hydrolase [Ascidiimonas aurantiaca]|uniref:hydrolase n=1 Tax=Ascidiimonas aurantiaca TaxID=1685432 RepID=UPI0030ED42C3
MKSRIFLYLFIFTMLIALFQYVNTKKYVEATDEKIERLENKVTKLQDSTEQLLMENLDLHYFDLENNDDALSYYDHLQITDLPGYIADRLLETNEKKGDNPLVPYAGMNGDMKINKIKILNHKWIIADFSDGSYWGELLLSYEMADDGSVSFTLIAHLLYTGIGM